MVLWFEVDDTGCGIDPSKWDSVFESFEQADPSTTQTHGGTGLGLCIVRNLVNKMGGDIKVVQKNGLGTTMRLYLILSISDNADQICQPDFSKYGLVVLLSMCGSTARSIQSKWLRKHGIATVEASDWNELTEIIRDLFETGSRENSFDLQHNIAESLRAEISNIQEIKNPVYVIVVDVGVLDLTTDIWKEQLNYLDRFCGKAKFAWLLKHDTSNTVKTELRRKGHVMMVNKPLYKAKMIQILEAVIKNRSDESHDCLEIDPTQSDSCSSDDSSETARDNTSPVLKSYLLDITKSNDDTTCASMKEEDWKDGSNRLYSGVALDGKNEKSLEGIRILLAEDTPVLQRVATIMLEKMGATVTAVWDGQQAVDALNYNITNPQSDSSPYDLILMDCQMPKMDGYEATKAIRRAEIGRELHIPIVALTAHAMSSDEAKCLEVGMDAYLTKPIDRKLMVSTILSLTKPSTSFSN